MAGMPRGESDIAQQTTDPITQTPNEDDSTSSYNKARLSASNMMEKIAGTFQPGDNKSTTRGRADVPPGVNTTGNLGQEGDKTMLQEAQETVSKALGGGARGSRS